MTGFRSTRPAVAWLRSVGMMPWGDPSTSEIVRVLRLALATYESSAKHHEEYLAFARKRAAEVRVLLADLGEGAKS